METCPEVPVLVVELALTPPIQQVTPPLSPPGTLSLLVWVSQGSGQELSMTDSV